MPRVPREASCDGRLLPSAPAVEEQQHLEQLGTRLALRLIDQAKQAGATVIGMATDEPDARQPHDAE